MAFSLLPKIEGCYEGAKQLHHQAFQTVVYNLFRSHPARVRSGYWLRGRRSARPSEIRKNIDGRGVEISQVGERLRGARIISRSGDADRDLKHFDNGFDYAILSQTLQATQRPDSVLKELARIGKSSLCPS